MSGKRWIVPPASFVWLMVPLALVFAFPAVSAGVDVGDKAPDFELPSTMGGKIKLSDFAGKKNEILEFYILDFAPV